MVRGPCGSSSEVSGFSSRSAKNKTAWKTRDAAINIQIVLLFDRILICTS
jgi:hypothetical protein